MSRDLDRLVLDYLVIEGYKSAAEQFSKELNLDPESTDFAAIEARMAIRDQIQRGQVDKAIAQLNDTNPQVSPLSHQSIPVRVRERKRATIITFFMHHSQTCRLSQGPVKDDLNHARCVLYELSSSTLVLVDRSVFGIGQLLTYCLFI